MPFCLAWLYYELKFSGLQTLVKFIFIKINLKFSAESYKNELFLTKRGWCAGNFKQRVANCWCKSSSSFDVFLLAAELKLKSVDEKN